MVAPGTAAQTGSLATGTRTAAGRKPAACLVPGAREPLERIWRPDMTAAIAFARHRSGDIAFAVRTRRRFFGYRADHVEESASVVKAMLMVAYMHRPSVARRRLNGYDRSLLIPMITHSDNNAASIVDGIVGNGGLEALARRVGMTHFQAVAQPWGATQITARDQTRFFLHIDRLLPRRHRAFAMFLLASITSSQRWGIGQVARRGWHLYFKGGWGYGTGLLDHQVVLLTRGCARVSVAVLTMYDGSHSYGKATLRAIFARLLHGFPTGAPRVSGRAGRSLQRRGEGWRHNRRGHGRDHPAGTIDFATGPGGQQARRAVLTLSAPGDPCDANCNAGAVPLARDHGEP